MRKMLLSTAEVAEQIGVPAETLRYWRHRGIGPRSFKLGPKKVRYAEEDLHAWIAQQRGTADGGDAA